MHRHNTRTTPYYDIPALSPSAATGTPRNGAILHVACTIGYHYVSMPMRRGLSMVRRHSHSECTKGTGRQLTRVNGSLVVQQRRCSCSLLSAQSRKSLFRIPKFRGAPLRTYYITRYARLGVSAILIGLSVTSRGVKIPTSLTKMSLLWRATPPPTTIIFNFALFQGLLFPFLYPLKERASVYLVLWRSYAAKVGGFDCRD